MTPSVPIRFRALPGRSLTHGAVEALGRTIASGAYDGKRFPTEGELATQLGVSRSVVREAVKMLTAKGLLSARPRQGTVVEPTSTWSLFDAEVLGWVLDGGPSPALLRKLHELWAAVLPKAAGLAAKNADDVDRMAIRRCYDRLAAADDGDGDPSAADAAFLGEILHATSNPLFVQLGTLASQAVRGLGRVGNPFRASAPDPRLRRDVLSAVEARDEEAAVEAMELIVDQIEPGGRVAPIESDNGGSSPS